MTPTLRTGSGSTLALTNGNGTMTKSGFDLDEIERLLAAATPGEWRVELDMRTEFRYAPEREEYEYIAGYNVLGDVEVIGCEGIIPGNHSEHDAALIVTLHNSAPAMITEIRELRAENARLKGHWSALDKALADNIIETDQSHRVRWEGEWHYGPLADAYFAMIGAVRDCARAALGEHQ